MPVPPSLPTSPRRSERSRRAVLAAATELVAEQPYQQVSVEAIAARAGVSKATIYRWWPSKGHVVVDALAAGNAERPDETMAIPDTGDLEADMAGVLRAVADEFSDSALERLVRALAIESLLDADLRSRVLERIFLVQLEHVERRFAAARAAGQMRDDVPTLVAFELFVAPVFHRWQNGTAPLDHAHADLVAALAVRALRPDAAGEGQAPAATE